MPLAAETRTFWLDGQLILAHNYWDGITPFTAPTPADELKAIAATVPSRFFSMDTAIREDGEWSIIELGDGQVTGLPTPALAQAFYRCLADVLSNAPTRPN